MLSEEFILADAERDLMPMRCALCEGTGILHVVPSYTIPCTRCEGSGYRSAPPPWHVAYNVHGNRLLFWYTGLIHLQNGNMRYAYQVTLPTGRVLFEDIDFELFGPMISGRLMTFFEFLRKRAVTKEQVVFLNCIQLKWLSEITPWDRNS